MKIFALLAILVPLILTMPAHAAEETIISDRPGDTDNPKTMDRGQFRTETGVYSYTHDVAAGVHTTTQRFGNVFLIGGVAKDMELQVAYDGFAQEQITTGGERQITRASGGETVRYKWNLVGNRKGRFALALLPRIQKAEGIDGEDWQGALGVPFAFDITDNLNLSLTPEWRVETNEQTDRRAHGAYNAIVLSYDISDTWGVFAQNSEHTRHIRDDWAVTAGGGATYKASKKLQLDVGLDFGLTGAADNFDLKAGFTYVL